METQISRFNRLLLILMLVLYLLSLAAFSYANWKVESEPQIWSLALSALILSIPLLLFYGSIFVLVSAWREHHLTGEINPRLARVLYWTPRIAAILIIFFVSLFSLDVFEMEASPPELFGAFLMHNLPSIAMVVVLLFAWRKPLVGFIAFLLVGVFFLRFVISGQGLGHFLLFSGPLLLIACLFYANWRWLRSLSHASQNPVV